VTKSAAKPSRLDLIEKTTSPAEDGPASWFGALAQLRMAPAQRLTMGELATAHLSEIPPARQSVGRLRATSVRNSCSRVPASSEVTSPWSYWG